MDSRRETKQLANGWATTKLRQALGSLPPTLDAEGLARALQLWRLVAVASVGASNGGSSQAVEDMREEAMLQLREQQREVTQLVGSLRCAALKTALAQTECQDECTLRRAVRAWTQAI